MLIELVIDILNEQTATNLNKIIRRYNNEKNSEGVKQKRPRAKSDLDEEPAATTGTLNTLPTPPPSPPARTPQQTETTQQTTEDQESAF